jgi:threonine dehydratase
MTSLIDRIYDAHRGIRPHVRVTPLEHSAALSASLGCEVLLKCDHLQPSGAFKLRGATNKIRLLAEQGGHPEVVTASTGNHGRAVAYAGRQFGIKVTVYVGNTTPPVKADAIRAEGATLVTIDGESLEAELEARRVAQESGIPYVAPYNDYDTIAGQGTLGIELAEQAQDLDAVFICVGGGGLISGVGTALKALSPRTQIVGVWPQASTCMLDSLHAGKIIATPEYPTLSDGSTGAVEPGSVTFPICQQVIDTTLTVSEQEIARGMRAVADAEHWMVEGAAGVAMAGLMQAAEAYRGKKVAVVLCGRNVGLETFLDAMKLGAS